MANRIVSSMERDGARYSPCGDGRKVSLPAKWVGRHEPTHVRRVVSSSNVVQAGFGVPFFAGVLVGHRIMSIDTHSDSNPDWHGNLDFVSFRSFPRNGDGPHHGLKPV